MSRYIDADHFADVLEESLIHVAIATRGKFSIQQEYKFDIIKGIVDTLRAMPPADVVHIRHGAWLLSDIGMTPNPDDVTLKCGECHYYASTKRDAKGVPWGSPYCPNCGAKMDNEAEQ